MSKELLNDLQKMKSYPRETYEQVIKDLIEDSKRVNKATRQELAESRQQAKDGKVKTIDDVEEELGL